MKILTAKDVQGVGSLDFTKKILLNRIGRFPTEDFDETVSAKAEVNSGRWIVLCPFCTGAEMLDKEDKRFFCLSCYNKAVGGKWLKVDFPENAEEIEQELLKRPNPDNRNWKNETLEELKKEVAENGLDDS